MEFAPAGQLTSLAVLHLPALPLRIGLVGQVHQQAALDVRCKVGQAGHSLPHLLPLTHKVVNNIGGLLHALQHQANTGGKGACKVLQ